jgi:hypothetical protein
MDDQPLTQVSISRIPVRGGFGVLVLIAILILHVLADLPQLRLIYLGGVTLGLVFAFALIVWRRRTMDSHTLPPRARTVFEIDRTASASARATLPDEESRTERAITRPGAHPQVAHAR